MWLQPVQHQFSQRAWQGPCGLHNAASTARICAMQHHSQADDHRRSYLLRLEASLGHVGAPCISQEASVRVSIGLCICLGGCLRGCLGELVQAEVGGCVAGAVCLAARPLRLPQGKGSGAAGIQWGSWLHG